MVKKLSTRPASSAQAVTTPRAIRLYRLLRLLGTGAQTRSTLTRRLRLDVRGFYRDLELLRASGIQVMLQDHRYHLGSPVDEAIAQLPFPDPHLTLGDAVQLAKGRTRAHRYLREQIDQILA